MVNLKLLSPALLSVVLLFLITSCSSDKDEPVKEVEKVECSIHLSYEMNMTGANDISEEVLPVSVWAFDSEGRLKGYLYDNGNDIKARDYTLTMQLPAGTYDFVTWCGIEENAPFTLGCDAPEKATMEKLSLSLILKEGDNATKMFDSVLPAVYHGVAKNITVDRLSDETERNAVDIPLVKDTKKLRVMIQNPYKNDLDPDDFVFKIRDGNNFISWENTASSTEGFDYTPCEITSGKIDFTDDGNQGDNIIIADFFIFPIQASQDIRLIVSDKSSGKEIANVSLAENILKVKPSVAATWSDQEYLDRQDYYRMMFVFTNNRN